MHHRAMHGNHSRIAIYCATDKASLIPEVAMALKHTGAIVLSSSDRRQRFVQTAHGGSFKSLLPPMIDFHMLGETSTIVVAHFTSFSNMAAARTKRMLYTGSTQLDTTISKSCDLVFTENFVKNTPMHSNAHCGSSSLALTPSQY